MPNKLVLLTAFIFTLFAASPAQAKVITKEKGSVIIDKTEVINDDLFVAAESVDINGTVNGDVFAAAGTVNVSGKITGSLVIGAGEVQIEPTANIGGSLIVGAMSLDNQATVGRNLMAGAGSVKLNSSVAGEVRVGSGRLALGPKTVINGDLTYATENELNQAETALVKGKVTQYQAPEVKRFDEQKWFITKLAFHIISFFATLLTGLVVLWLFKIPATAIAEKINLKFMSSLGWGLVILFVVPPTLFLLALTGIGLPLAGITGLLFLIDLYVAKIFASLALGKFLQLYFGWQKLSVQWIFVIGLLAYSALRFIPVVGFFVHLVVLLVGLGGCWLSCRTRIRT